MMTTLLPSSSLQAQTAYWKIEYEVLLRRRLASSIRYVRENSQDMIKTHLRSLLALIDESQRYPSLHALTLKFIHLLNPLPIQWGMGNLWLRDLQFAVSGTPQTSLRSSYLADIADIEVANGNFNAGLVAADQVLEMRRSNPILLARACRAKFIALRSLGQADDADQLIHQNQRRFSLARGTKIDSRRTRAWIIYSQSKLELLREQGRIDDALDLVQQMLSMDARSDSNDLRFTAELLTLRSTLLWGKGNFPASIADLNLAIDKYTAIKDTFNAMSLQSNLGLVYWSMGEFDRAEQSLNTAILYHRNTGAVQSVTSDVGNMGLVHFARGNLAKARECFNEQIDLAKRISYMTEYYRGMDNLSDTCYYLGDYQSLVTLHKQQAAYLKFRGRREGYGVGLLWIACAEYRLGNEEKAVDEMRQVLDYAYSNENESLEELACRCLAQFLPIERREPLLHKALQICRSQGKIFEEAAVYLALAQVQHSKDLQQITWHKGVELLERIGASSWLEGHSPADPPFIPMFI